MASYRRVDDLRSPTGWLLVKERKGKEEYLYSAFLHQGTHKALRHGSHSFTCKQHHDCLYTGISSGPNARYRVREAFTFTLIITVQRLNFAPLSLRFSIISTGHPEYRQFGKNLYSLRQLRNSPDPDWETTSLSRSLRLLYLLRTSPVFGPSSLKIQSLHSYT